MDQSGKLLKDTRGYSCGRCRQRLLPNTSNVSEIQLQCPACKRIASAAACKTDGTVSYVVEKFKNKLLRRNNRQESDGSEKFISLNWNPSPLKSSSPPSSSRSDRRPRKRAVLVGVTYKRWKYTLKGTVNDVRNMRSFLIESFSFLPQNILVLTGNMFPSW